MATQYGTLSVLDSIAAVNAANVLEFGEENLAGYLQLLLDAYEGLVEEMVGDLVGFVPERETTYGNNVTSGEMVDLDEFGMADSQKIPFAQSAVGFPLRKIGYTIQWTRDYLAVTSPSELALQVLGATEADTRKIYGLIRTALFKATNVTTYRDRLTDNRNYTVRALVNADSQPIPPQPITGTAFNAATHTHYLATASFIEANLVSLVETVREHWVGIGEGRILVYINAAQEATVRAFAGFEPYVDSRIVYSTAADRAAATLDLTTLEDRAIGIHGPAEVWVKPWMPASYVLAFLAGTGTEPVLGWRRPEGAMAQFASLRLVADLDRYPLHARAWERRLGIAAWNRVRAAVLYTGGGSYVSFAG
jgi:hypothetical protein